MQRTLIIAVFTLFLSACASTSTTNSTAENPLLRASSTIGAAAAPVAGSAHVETRAQKLERVVKTLIDKSVYFDYDDYSVKTTYHDLLTQVSGFLKSTPDYSVSLVGNADERGSTEYNLALGQKRSESVKKKLKLLGVPESQLEAISYGEEKPRTTCHEEKCWAENRRVDFAYKKR